MGLTLGKKRKEVTYKDLSGLHKWFLIVLISMGSSIIYTPMYLKGVFYDPLMQALNCSNAELGAMVSCYGIAALITYLPSGIIADKFRMRTLAWVGFVTTAALCFVYATLPSIELCYIIFIAFGITSILIWWGTRFKVIRLCCSEEDYPSKIGISYSVYGAAGLVIGSINAVFVSSFAIPAMGVQAMIVLLGVIIGLMGVVSFLAIPNFRDEINRDSKVMSLADAARAIRYPGVLWACAAYFFVYAVYQGATYTTSYMTAVFAAPLTLASIVSLIRTSGIGLVAGPVAGFFAKKLNSPSKSILAMFAATIVVLFVFWFFPHNPDLVITVAVLVIVFGFVTYGAFSIGSSPLTEAHVPMEIFGTAVGILSVIGYLPDVFIHTWFGSMIDASGNDAFGQIFMWLIIFAVLGCICLLFTRRAMKKNIAAEVVGVRRDEAKE